ncbi:MAG: hypothetical protein V9G12_10595 [Microthrixaceae bacterium]
MPSAVDTCTSAGTTKVAAASRSKGQRGKRDRAGGGAVADVGGGTGSNGGERGGHDVEVLDPRRRDLDAECLAPPPQLAAR